MKGTVVILCAGGPAPGINAVISSVSRAFLRNGYFVLGLQGGYRPLCLEEESGNYIPIDLSLAERIHGRGGSALRMSRFKPDDSQFRTDFFIRHNVSLLVTIGGDDTASTANRMSKFLAANNLPVANIHVPKTIDNDLPLPEGRRTFGFKTAKEEGSRITLTITEEARSTGCWFVVSAMGREAGHLAFAIGEACHSAMIIVPEMFQAGQCTLDRIVSLMVSSIVKRSILGLNHGVIIVSEGVFHFIAEEELKSCGIQFEYDEHGHPELGIVSKGQIFNTLLQRRLKELGIKLKTRPNDLGYEIRCVRPIASDLQYCTALGAGVYKLFTEGLTGCMVVLDKDDRILPLYLDEVADPETGKIVPRLLNLDSDVVRQTINTILHFLTPIDYLAAKKWLENPEDYDFNKILNG